MQINLYNELPNPRPFLKWAGGKKQVIKYIDSSLPNEIKESGVIDKYFEPFLGGGAIFFHLVNNYKINEIYLGDINKDLILSYKMVRDYPRDLIKILTSFEEDYLHKNKEVKKDFFYNIRDEFNNALDSFDYENFSNDHIKRAAHMIFLNKTCFNGLYRVNQQGKFNVPMGSYVNPTICDKSNILAVSNVLQNVTIVDASYLDSESLIDKNSFVYLDPPYRPLSKTSYFNSYSKNVFADEEQEELAKYYKRITDKGAKVILSNSDPKNENEDDEYFDELYNGFKISRVQVNRFINSKSDKRGPINEILIKNY